jgi:hypothetical protein
MWGWAPPTPKPRRKVTKTGKVKTVSPKEWHEQRAVFDWARDNYEREPRLRMLTGSMNGLKSTPRSVAIAKLCGFTVGFPDIFLAVVGYANCPGLLVELKRQDYKPAKTPTATELAQAWWRDNLRAQGYQVEQCNGAQAAIAVISLYLEMG